MSGMKMREWAYRRLRDKKKEPMGIQILFGVFSVETCYY